MIKKISRKNSREKRHYRLRNKISGTSEIPRLCVFRSNKHIYAQLINDEKRITLVSASTMEKSISETLKTTSDIKAASEIGAIIAKRAIGKGIYKAVFDRSGYIYHGKVKALAESARESGLQF